MRWLFNSQNTLRQQIMNVYHIPSYQKQINHALVYPEPELCIFIHVFMFDLSVPLQHSYLMMIITHILSPLSLAPGISNPPIIPSSILTLTHLSNHQPHSFSHKSKCFTSSIALTYLQSNIYSNHSPFTKSDTSLP